MNFAMGSQIFRDVQIPLLWGSRAVLQDRQGRLSVIDLSQPQARLEIVGDEPAPGVEFLPTEDGFEILGDGQELYRYSPREKKLASVTLDLPECQVTDTETKIGSNTFSGNIIIGFDVGIVVTKDGMGIGAPLPPGLAKLVIP